jgi:hypothetical protein
MDAVRDRSLLNDKFHLSVQRVFVSVGLAPIVSDSTVIPKEHLSPTEGGHSTPGTIRKEFLQIDDVNADVFDDREIQTIGGLGLIGCGNVIS